MQAASRILEKRLEIKLGGRNVDKNTKDKINALMKMTEPGGELQQRAQLNNRIENKNHLANSWDNLAVAIQDVDARLTPLEARLSALEIEKAQVSFDQKRLTADMASDQVKVKTLRIGLHRIKIGSGI